MISLVIFRILLATMLEWKEQEHESDDFLPYKINKPSMLSGTVGY
jgi:hypothetical protein